MTRTPRAVKVGAKLASMPEKPKAKTQGERLLDGIGRQFTAKELKAISAGAGVGRVTPIRVNLDFRGEEVCFGYFCDPHMGSIYYHEDFLEAAVEKWTKAKVDFVICGGDVTNGMDPRKYNILFESTHIGFAAQKEYGAAQLRRIPFPLYVIDGNHDRWYEAMGGHIVEDICREVPGATYLGRDEGRLTGRQVGKLGKVDIMVFHGEDGSSYATSYRIQKLVECVPLDSEILTRNGWKKHNEIKIGTEVMGYDSSTGRCEWTKVEAIHRYDSAEVVCYKNENFIVRATRNHKWAMTVEHRAGPNKHSKVPVPYRKMYKGLFTIDEAKGEWKRHRIVQAAPCPDGHGLVLHDHTDWINRKIAIENVLQMTSQERRGFILGMIYGEGSHIKRKSSEGDKGTIVFSQNPGPVAEAFKLACFMEGVAVGSTQRVSKKINGDIKICGRTTMLRKPERMVDSIVEQGVTVQPVWCPTTGLGTWVMRQGDTITITGNSFTGGEKPHVLLVGHSHKQGYFFDRNIHAVTGGALSTQSRFMRSKRLACHSGYQTCRMTVNGGGVGEFTYTWKGFYA